MITNLIYHIFATDSELMWWNLRMIKQYLPIFNGKRIFTIANKDTRNSPLSDTIINFLGSENTYFVVDNDIDRTYGGTYPFFEVSAPQIANTNENEFLFHAHSKGASYTEINPCVLLWTKAMYDLNLGQFAKVKDILTEYDTYGIFKRTGTAFGNRVNWHYPGAFWWVRHTALFSYPWNTVEKDACATEILPSQFIPSERAYNGLELPYEFIDLNKPYAADQLYNINCWKTHFATHDLTSTVKQVLYADI